MDWGEEPRAAHGNPNDGGVCDRRANRVEHSGRGHSCAKSVEREHGPSGLGQRVEVRLATMRKDLPAAASALLAMSPTGCGRSRTTLARPEA